MFERTPPRVRRRAAALLATGTLLLGAAASAQELPPRANPGPPVPAPSVPAASPQITLAPEDTAPEPPSYTLNDLLGTGRRLGIGGYGEAQVILDGPEREVNLKRFVLFVGYRFADWARLYSEIEVEDGHEIEMEQAYLELEPRRWLGVRAGLMLVPVGLHNLVHEPGTFLTVERPLVDTVVVPSTWRELGVGVYGTPLDGLHYQLNAMSGLDADKFSSGGLLVGGRGNGRTAHLDDVAVAGRVNFDGLTGLDVAASGYWGGAGQDVAELGGVRVGIVEADARFKRWGLTARAEYARFFIRGAERITALQRETNLTAGAIPSSVEAAYADAGYNVVRLVSRTSRHELVPFAGYEYVNRHAPKADTLKPEETGGTHYLDVGLKYDPHPQITFKFNYRRRLAAPKSGEGAEESGVNRFTFGLGFMF